MVRWPRDFGLQVRMLGTLFVLGVIYFIFIAVLAYIGVETLLLLAVMLLVLLIQYFFSDRMVLWSMGAREVSEQEEPHLTETLTRLCAIANLPRPRLALVDSAVPNAFATGRNPKNSVIAVTSSLVSTLSQDELEAVLAHELSHVKNRDVMVITFAGFLSTAAYFLFRNWLTYGSGLGSGSGGRRSDKAALLIIIPLLAAVVWLISFLLIKALSRYREFAADRGSAILTGNPSHLASALVKISGEMSGVPTKDLRSVEGMNAFFIIPAISGTSILNLLSTHPTVEQRLAALERIQREMKG
ncbi:MAG TPA: zinc metalloprotease HtpX [Methanoregula sp.]|nr:zinc metalloprotease HtpX [Methanoregula sp.]